MSTIIDRMTVNWQGEHEVAEAKRFRQVVGDRKINQTIKRMIRDFLKNNSEQDHT